MSYEPWTANYMCHSYVNQQCPCWYACCCHFSQLTQTQCDSNHPFTISVYDLFVATTGWDCLIVKTFIKNMFFTFTSTLATVTPRRTIASDSIDPLHSCSYLTWLSGGVLWICTCYVRWILKFMKDKKTTFCCISHASHTP